MNSNDETRTDYAIDTFDEAFPEEQEAHHLARLEREHDALTRETSALREKGRVLRAERDAALAREAAALTARVAFELQQMVIEKKITEAEKADFVELHRVNPSLFHSMIEKRFGLRLATQTGEANAGESADWWSRVDGPPDFTSLALDDSEEPQP